MATREIQEPWLTAMRNAGIGDPRNGTPSLRGLAATSGVSLETVRQMLLGREPEPANLAKVADALKLDPRLVSRWIGHERTVKGPYKPHPDADLLDKHERDAINKLIGMLAASKKGLERVETDASPTPLKSAAAYKGDGTDQSRK